jgi:hypothetical protein
VATLMSLVRAWRVPGTGGKVAPQRSPGTMDSVLETQVA